MSSDISDIRDEDEESDGPLIVNEEEDSSMGDPFSDDEKNLFIGDAAILWGAMSTCLWVVGRH